VSDRLVAELMLGPDEQAIVERVFGAGRSHPWTDNLVDEMMDWIGRVALSYLAAKRDPAAIICRIPEFRAFLDRIVLERFESARAAAEEVHEFPPYRAADHWPRTELPVVKAVIAWAFDDFPA